MTAITAKLVVYAEGDILFSDGYHKVFTGNVYGDTKGRWTDGRFIRTSPVVKVEGDLIYTENSVYQMITEPPV